MAEFDARKLADVAPDHPDFARLLENCAATAERAARHGGNRLLESYRNVTAREKGPFDLVTDADLASQRVIVETILETHPGHTILGEEGLQADPTNPWKWIVDPLDGTVNFAHGLPPWCVSIGLEAYGELVVGVIHVPLEQATFRAVKGAGAVLNGQPIQVSSIDSMEGAVIATGFPTYWEPHDPDRLMALFRRFCTRTHSVRRSGSSAWNLAMTAAGAFDICYATVMQPWDAAAGVVLVREAGGQVTDLEGQPYNLERQAILATNGRLHAEALEAIRQTDTALGRRSQPAAN
jgi:myo-inositol-1(or 4)-monophosphatase